MLDASVSRSQLFTRRHRLHRVLQSVKQPHDTILTKLYSFVRFYFSENSLRINRYDK